MLDRRHLGHRFQPYSLPVEAGQLQFFAKAIGETNPIYSDPAAARRAGYRNIPAPPTFPMVLDMAGPEYLPVVRLLGLDIRHVLHASQRFEYFAPICAGDVITVDSTLVELRENRRGTMNFVTIENHYTNQLGELTAKAFSSLIYRCPAPVAVRKQPSAAKERVTSQEGEE